MSGKGRRLLALLGLTGGVLVISATATVTASHANAADLRLRMNPPPARSESATSLKQQFEEFLRWKRQQSR
jgi:hypothetical protein